jgi:hypothetical protein
MRSYVDPPTLKLESHDFGLALSVSIRQFAAQLWWVFFRIWQRIKNKALK